MLASLHRCTAAAGATSATTPARLRRPGHRADPRLQVPDGLRARPAPTGWTRVAWKAGTRLPVVQCFKVARKGNAISGLTVRLLQVSRPIPRQRIADRAAARSASARRCAADCAAVRARSRCRRAAGGACAATPPAAAPRRRRPPGPWYKDGPSGRYLLGGTWLFRPDDGVGLQRPLPGLDVDERLERRSRVPNAWNAGQPNAAGYAPAVGWYRKDFVLPSTRARGHLDRALRIGQQPRHDLAERSSDRRPTPAPSCPSRSRCPPPT